MGWFSCERDVLWSICCSLIDEYPMKRRFSLKAAWSWSSRDVFLNISEPVSGRETSPVFVSGLLCSVEYSKNTTVHAHYEKFRALKILDPEEFLRRSLSWETASLLNELLPLFLLSDSLIIKGKCQHPNRCSRKLRLACYSRLRKETQLTSAKVPVVAVF
jgi:hypothetical protein